MPGRINDEDIQALRERADLAAVVGNYTALQRAGGGRLKGLCPLHQEKTPSFTVDAAKGYFHCFGCGEGGDVYAFLGKIEALTFPEAVERLARIEGYELRYADLRPGERRALSRRTRLTDALAEAASFYAGQLTGPGGEPARAYLEARGLDDEAIRHFRLGWAPDDWESLVRHLHGKGFEPEEVGDAGLATRGPRGMIDRFRGRVIFPILERGGRDVVAFGGRILPGAGLRTGPRDGEPPKYINSAESVVYRKSETLYGLNWARGEIVRRAETALVVEGYMDVIGLHQVGVRHAVATCGTALTADHFRQLEKFARRVVLALDADDAGFAAADRARALADEVGIREVGVLPLPAGQDPADLASAGIEAVELALKGIKTAVEFQIEHLLQTADTATPEAQVDAYRRTFPLLGKLEDRFLRYSYVRDLVAPAVRLSADLIERELDASLPAPSPGSGDPAPARRSARAANPQLQLERDVLRVALQSPELLPAAWQDIVVEDFTAVASRQLFEALRSAPRGDLAAVLALLPDDDARARVRALAMSDATIEPDSAHVDELLRRLRAAALDRQYAEVRAELDRMNEALDPAERRRLAGRLFELQRSRRTLVEGGAAAP
jgi:DNA primase